MSNDETERGGEKEAGVLAYRRPAEGRAGRLVGRVPEWVIALVLVVPMWAAETLQVRVLVPWARGDAADDVAMCVLLAVVFVAGAVRRWKWKQMLVMLAAACACGVTLAAVPNQLPIQYHEWELGLKCAIPLVVLAFMETLLAQPRLWRALGSALEMAAAAACVMTTILISLDQGFDFAYVPGAAGVKVLVRWDSVVFWPMLAVLGWLAVAWGRKLARDARVWHRLAAGAATVALAVVMVLYVNVWIYDVAAWSLTGAGPFNRERSAWLLTLRDDAASRGAMWTALERADWSTHSSIARRDYLAMCLGHLAEVDRAEAGKRLASLLRRRPSERLATFSAEILAAEHRYEAVPELMRYSLQYRRTITRVLGEMGVPQAAAAELSEALIVDRPPGAGWDFPVESSRRRRLVGLLGKDVGDSYQAWDAYYVAVVSSRPTPLPEDVAKETQRVANAMLIQHQVFGRFLGARFALLRQRLEKDGHGMVRKRLDEAIRSGASVNAGDTEIYRRYMKQAEADLTVQGGDWNVPGTEALEREVRAYGQRVEARMKELGIEAEN